MARSIVPTSRLVEVWLHANIFWFSVGHNLPKNVFVLEELGSFAVTEDRIVAVGLLTQRDLDVLGNGFRRMFTVEDGDMFADLLEKLDEIEIEPCGQGVTIMPGPTRR